LQRTLREARRLIPKSTLYRHLKRASAAQRRLGVSQQKVHCHWTRDQSNALWLGDFEDGSYVMVGDRAVETHLSAFIDCHSRYIVEARYYLRENLDIVIDSLLRAWSVHWASRKLYLDNAEIHYAHALQLTLDRLNQALTAWLEVSYHAHRQIPLPGSAWLLPFHATES
jgi:transposase InsO family protein